MSSNWYAMSDQAIAELLGQRLDQYRKDGQIISQKDLAHELGISESTLRLALKGRGKFSVMIGIMRTLGILEQLHSLIPDRPVSPLKMLEQGSHRPQRVRSKISTEPDQTNPGAGSPSNEELDW
ncbi:XRE family transcriptional regulator [Motiliproteus coralliicola]|uniref:XRE family transcriptional regulator n=1 Tax=Motiliproteus coralliicola TaxID=2283196 RepID=A0A369WVN5_9GAMM|nr:helix-turn-helix transcriptional regulator [Motiliproteus coralliicola]RDE24614.1 XRE family transcriptional regulator [Motiliproteus coralliicola]